jgi:hypothetical protein
MANFELKFLDEKNEMFIQVNKKTIELYTCNKDFIQINLGQLDAQEMWIYLDKSTAIKFAKTLRTEINKITESEAKNG